MGFPVFAEKGGGTLKYRRISALIGATALPAPCRSVHKRGACTRDAQAKKRAIVGIATKARASALPFLFIAELVVGGAAFGQAAQPKFPDDIHLLIGKHVIVGRLPLCVPNTYTPNLSYAGKPATVLSIKENPQIYKLSPEILSRIPSNFRSMMEDQAKGGTVLFQFEDGTQLDTCTLVGPNVLSQSVELAAGETITPPAEKVTEAGLSTSSSPSLGSSVTLPAQQCPVVVTSLSSGFSLLHSFADALTTSEFERQVDKAANGGQDKHYLDMRMRNASEKPIAGFEIVTAYANKMGDRTNSATQISQNTSDIKPGEELKTYTMDRGAQSLNGVGTVTVYISRVRFSDNTFWQDDGSHSCSRSTTSE